MSAAEEWRGKGLRVRWIDGSCTDFLALSAEHWSRLKAFYDRWDVDQRLWKWKDR